MPTKSKTGEVTKTESAQRVEDRRCGQEHEHHFRERKPAEIKLRIIKCFLGVFLRVMPREVPLLNDGELLTIETVKSRTNGP